MARRDIDKWSIGYWFFQVIWIWLNLKLYYKKIGVFNKHKIPNDAPVIIAPNHQNALMDALAVVTQGSHQWVFLTRADVFNKPFVERILYLFKMLPIFRIRDGRTSLQKNEEIFDAAVKILHNKRSPLCMFPEGNHGDKRRLRPLVKGIFRIAFMAQEKYKDQPGVKIIPTGIDYEHYQKFGKTLLVNFGDPIEVSEYWKEYEESPALATNSLRERLASEMKKIMIDITTDDYYQTYMALKEIYRPTLLKKLKLQINNSLQGFQADKELIQSLDKTLANNPEKVEALHSKTERYVRLREKTNLREWVFQKSRYSYLFSMVSILLSILLLPVLLFGLINNWPNFFIPIKFVKKIKDPQFRSTAAFGLGLALQIIYYPILIALGFIFLPNLWLKLIYIPLIPLSGKAAYSVWKLLLKNIVKIRYNLTQNRNKNIKTALILRTEIIEELNVIIN
jgi:1-acyl-sn-glycerol-3-phosphate acyltransferase